MNKKILLDKLASGELNPFPTNRKSCELLLRCLESDSRWCDKYLETLVEQGIIPVVTESEGIE